MCTAEKKRYAFCLYSFQSCHASGRQKSLKLHPNQKKKKKDTQIDYHLYNEHKTKQSWPGRRAQLQIRRGSLFFHFIQPTIVTRNLIENIKYDAIQSLGDTKFSELDKNPAMDLHCKTMSKLEYDVTTAMTQTSERQRPSSLCDPDKEKVS